MLDDKQRIELDKLNREIQTLQQQLVSTRMVVENVLAKTVMPLDPNKVIDHIEQLIRKQSNSEGMTLHLLHATLTRFISLIKRGDFDLTQTNTKTEVTNGDT